MIKFLKNKAKHLLLFAFFASLAPLLFKLLVVLEPMSTKGEQFDPKLLNINTIGKVVKYVDCLYNIKAKQTFDTATYVLTVSKVVSDKFYHGTLNYRFSENWIAYLCSKIIWSHLSSIVITNDILKHTHSFCSQQTIVFMDILMRKKINVRSVGLGTEDTAGHFLCEVYYEGKWHLHDVNLEPKWERIKHIRESLSYYLQYKDSLYTVYDGILPKIALEKMLQDVEYGPVNVLPGGNLRLFQQVTKIMTYVLPIIFMILFLFVLFKQKKSVNNQNKISSSINFNPRKYQICTRCVMDTTDIAITFNKAGECNHCVEYLEKRIKYKYKGGQSDTELEHLLSEIKTDGKGKDYDCLVGLSGGLDSSYVAYLCKKHGLRVLAVHVDNGWNSTDSVQNIINITRKLEIAYDSYVLDWEEFKDVQLAFLKAAVPEAETPSDIALLAALHQVAAKYDIKYLISGGNIATEGILPKYWHYDAKDRKYFNAIYNKFGTKKLKKFPFFGFVKEAYYKLVKKIKIIYLLNHVNYIKEDVTKTLEVELDWQSYGEKHHESIYTKFIQSYYLYEKFGIDYRRATFSSKICTGDMKREEALLQLETLPYDKVKIQSVIEYVCKKLSITQIEFNEIMKQPVKWYSDYPNNEKKLKFIYDTYRKLFKKEKLGNF